MERRRPSRTRRTDLGTPVDAYLSDVKGPMREVCDALVAAVKEAVPDATGELKWGMPVYSHHGMLCYFRAYAHYVRFGFYDHADGLDDPGARLEGTGKGRNVKLYALADLDRPRLVSWIREVAARNAAEPAGGRAG